jgi:protein TonB
MSYANRKQMSGNRTVAIVIVALLHAVLGYALVTGLAYNVIKKAAEDLKTFDVTEEPPPPEEVPPPPPDQPQLPPPPTSPPAIVRTNLAPPPMVVAPTPPVFTPAPIIHAAPPPPAPPPPPRTVKPASARANLASYVSTDDYPQDALRNGESGSTGFRLEVGPNGRVTNCTVTSSSGSRSLDSATCRIMQSRARFKPATDSNGNPTSDSVSARIRWELPAD